MSSSLSPFLKPFKLQLSLVVVKLFFIFGSIAVFSTLLYVIFDNRLTHIREIQKLQVNLLEPLEKNAFSIKEGTSRISFLLSHSVYQGGLAETDYSLLVSQQLNSPLDSIKVLLSGQDYPEAILILTSLKLSLHHYQKLTDEALFLNAHAAQALSQTDYKDVSFKQANADLQKKIKQEINPQAKEIQAQITDLLVLIQAKRQTQQQEVNREDEIFRLTILTILVLGGTTAFFLIRSLLITLVLQRRTLKNHLQEIQDRQVEILESQQLVKEREARIRGVINNTSNGILAIDKACKITVLNNVLKELFEAQGISLQLGSDFAQVIKKHKPEWKPAIDKALAGESGMYATQVKETEESAEIYYNPIKNEEGQFIGSAIFIQDLTERTRKEKEIRQLLEKADLQNEQMLAQESVLLDTLQQIQQSQEQLQIKEVNLSAVVNNTDDKIVAIDTHYTITVINAALIKECASKGIYIGVGSDYRTIFTGVAEEEWKPNYERAFAGEKFVLECMPNVLNPEELLEVAFNPIKDKAGKVTGICVFVHDITEREKAEQEKQKLYQETQENAEELQAQQEELRQNLEELMSTQEELEKTQLNLRLKEARLRALINNTSDAIFSIDQQHAVTVLNNTMQQLYAERYGLIKEGDNFLKMLPADKKKVWKEHFNRTFAGEHFTQIWEEIYNTDTIYYELYFNPVKTEANEIIGVSVFIKDITERKKQELEKLDLLRQAEEREEEMMSQQEILRDNLQELMLTRDALETKEAQLSSQINAINKSNNIIELNLEGNIIDVNDNFLKLSQYTRKELKGKSYQTLIPEEDLELEDNITLWKKLQKGEFYSGEFRRITRKANFIWLKATYNPVLDAQGKPYKIIMFAFDITDRVLDGTEKKRLYEKISKDAEELRMQEEELRQNLEELKVTQEALVQQKEHIQEKEARLRALIDNTEDDIFAIDTHYKIIVLNKSVQTRYAKQGLSLELGYNIFSIIPQSNTAYWKVNFDKAISGEKFSIVDQVATKDGDVYYDISFNPIRNDKNRVIGVSVLSRNINQYKMAEKENLQTIDILRKIQEKVASMNTDKEKEIDTYKKKVEMLRNEMNGKIN